MVLWKTLYRCSFVVALATSNKMTRIPSSLRGVFVGSGSDGLSDPRIAQVILAITTKEKPRVLYLGTATYDLPQFAKRQTDCFVDCHVDVLTLVHETPSAHQVQEHFDKADIIVVGGGNTLYAVDRWKNVPSVISCLHKAMERGVILTGGSAGAICWFDGGHSDSMDPETHYRAMMQQYGNNGEATTTTTTTALASTPDESSSAPATTDATKDWKYIRIPGLGFLPGLLCPHHDKIQSNGVLRAHDFDQMLLKHPGEVGIGIDHWAALVVEGEGNYRVVSLPDKPGSVLFKNGQNDRPLFSPDAKGVPGIWIKRVVNGHVLSTLLPPQGNLADVLQQATEIVQDQQELDQCRKANPDIMTLKTN